MDPRPIELHPAAIEEGRSAREWYEERSASASNAFMAELDVAIERIAADPERHASYLHGTRRYLLKRFPFFVVFRIVPDRSKSSQSRTASESPDIGGTV